MKKAIAKNDSFFQSVCKPSSVLTGHLSRRIVTETLKRYETSRANYMFQLLHQVGFTQPISLPNCWCALTAPFHPYSFIKNCGLFLLHYP